MNELIIKTDLSLVNDDELVTSYVLTQKAIPPLEENIVNEMLKRNIDGKTIMLNGQMVFVDKQQTEKSVDTKINNLAKIIKHCLQNGINEIWENLTIKQTWLNEQKFYDHSFYEDSTKIMKQKPYKVKVSK